MKSIRDFFALLLFLMLMTYFVMFFKDRTDSAILGHYDSLSDISHNERYFVIWEENEVSLRLPIEHFLIGALAATIQVEYEPEVLKAQAIMLRSTLYEKYKMQEKKTDGECVLTIGAEEGSFWTDYRMQSVWGDQYESNLRKCMDAVVQTQGIYLAQDGKPIRGFYHGMSGGKTRGGDELSGEKNYGYLKATDCVDNLSDPGFEEEKIISAGQVGVLEEEIKNESGYVISVKRDGNLISGEKLREELGLASSNLSWTKEGNTYIFRTKGKGHGFGLDQYYGNVLAKKGMDYREIIAYFFTDVTYRRME